MWHCFLVCFYVLVCSVCEGRHMPPHACGYLRATMWVLGLELKSPWLTADTFTSRAILPTPVFIFYNFPSSIIITLFMESLKSTSNKFSLKNMFALNIYLFLFKRLRRHFIIMLDFTGKVQTSLCTLQNAFLSYVWSWCGYIIVFNQWSSRVNLVICLNWLGSAGHPAGVGCHFQFDISAASSLCSG